MRTHLIRALPLLLGAGAAAGLSNGYTTTGAHADTCILSCEFGEAGNCQANHHIAPREGDTNEYGGGYHDTQCYPGDCDYGLYVGEIYYPPQHPTCGVHLAQVFADLESGNPSDTKAAVAALGRNAVYVAERQSVQLVGCNGRILGNIPVSPATAELLAQ